MFTFLFATIPVAAHTSNPLPIAARLVERGHDVLWYAGSVYHERIAAVGAQPLPYVDAADFGGHDIFEYFPQFTGLSSLRTISVPSRTCSSERRQPASATCVGSSVTIPSTRCCPTA